MKRKTALVVILLLAFSVFIMPGHRVTAEESDLVDGYGGMVIADEEIIIGDRGDYFWAYENESGNVIGKFHTGYEKWDEMAACDVNGDGKAEIIQGDRSTDKIYIYTMEGTELGKHDVNFEAGDDIACGDLTGNGKAEIVHADRNNWISVFDEDFNRLNRFKVDDFADGDSIAVGDLDGDGKAEIVHADVSANIITLYDTNGNVMGSLPTEDYFELTSRDEIAIGDVNLDGLNELVIATQDSDDYQERGIHVFGFSKKGAQLEGRELATFVMPFQKGDRMAVGDVNADGLDEIVWASQDGYVKVYNLGGDLLNGPKGLKTEFSYGAGLAVGDVNGDSIVVGPPRKGRMHVENLVIAVINAPPVDYDVINKTGVFYSEFTTEKTQATKFSVKSTHDVKMSLGMKAVMGNKKVAYAEVNLKMNMGFQLQRERGRSYEESITYGLTSDMGDGALYVTTDYDVYEFPIISPPELAVVNGEQQYILVTVPKGPPHVHFQNYKSELHEIGDINTYPENLNELKNYEPGNLLDTFTIEVGQVGSSYERAVKELRWTKSKNTFNVGVSLGIGGGYTSPTSSLDLKMEGSYGYEKVTTHEVTVSNETSVKVVYKGGISDPSMWYNATGVIYLDSEDGHLVLDFLVPSKGEHYEARSGSPILINFGFFTIDYYALLLMNKPPECSISASPSSGKLPLEVDFALNLNDPENGSMRWEIDFGDGSRAEGNGTEVGHVYREEGKYKVILMVYDPWNANATCTAGINVKPNEKPTALFSYSPAEIKAGDEVLFTDSSTDPDGSVARWSWNFGDGSTSTERNPRHTYTNPGSYTVMLTVEDENGLKGTYYKEIRVEPQNYPPTADFTFLPKEPKAGEEISFADKSYDRDGDIVGWSWDFGDGSTSSEAEPIHVYSSAGNYTVTLKVRDDGGGEDVRRITITVGAAESPSPTETTSTEAPTTTTPSETTSSTPSGTTSSPEKSPSSTQPSPTESGSTCGPGIVVILAALLALWRRR
ncbi:PKD domain-containing protein [Thermococcus sp. 4557]|uniref:PKD domain-containing protein n=1 Tax=Thermococcus sp. (strain CGMCC 1.5172 / 4557) TaxID=1042877 RepID=UPI00064EE5CF|nr:PKD domain-containing protein [Thermococcus sp. 4557]